MEVATGALSSSATGTTSSGGWRRGSRPADRRRRRGKDSLSVADAPGFSSGYKDQAQQSQLPGESEEFSVEDIMRSISKPPNNRYSNDEEKGISYGSKLNNDEDRSKPKSKPKSSSNSSDNSRSRGSRSTTSDLYGAGIIDEHLEEKDTNRCQEQLPRNTDPKAAYIAADMIQTITPLPQSTYQQLF